jgi:hypothetical protein
VCSLPVGIAVMRPPVASRFPSVQSPWQKAASPAGGMVRGIGGPPADPAELVVRYDALARVGAEEASNEEHSEELDPDVYSASTRSSFAKVRRQPSA